MSELVLDERMTEETKSFIKQFLATNNLRDLIKMEPQDFRNLRATQEKHLNSLFKFENIE